MKINPIFFFLYLTEINLKQIRFNQKQQNFFFCFLNAVSLHAHLIFYLFKDRDHQARGIQDRTQTKQHLKLLYYLIKLEIYYNDLQLDLHLLQQNILQINIQGFLLWQLKLFITPLLPKECFNHKTFYQIHPYNRHQDLKAQEHLLPMFIHLSLGLLPLLLLILYQQLSCRRHKHLLALNLPNFLTFMIFQDLGLPL